MSLSSSKRLSNLVENVSENTPLLDSTDFSGKHNNDMIHATHNHTLAARRILTAISGASVDNHRIHEDFYQYCINGNIDMIKELMDKTIESRSELPVNTIITVLMSRGNKEQLNPIQLASFYDQANVLEYFLTLLSQHITQSCDLKPFEQELMAALVDDATPQGKQSATALMLSSSVQIAELLLHYGANMDNADLVGMTALHYAASTGNAGIVSLLIHTGADINKTDNRSATPLHWAVFEGYHYTAMLLVGQGADQSIQDSQLQTPLMLACALGDSFLAKQLVLEGAPLELKDRYGRTALDLANIAGHADTARAVQNGKSDRLIATLSRNGVTVSFFWIVFLVSQAACYVFTIPFTSYPFIFGIILVALFVVVSIAYLQVWLRDPGYVETSEEPVHVLLSTEGQGIPCPTCKTIKPIRSKHCHACRRCVYRFDHHCPWINNCVGANNHGWFFIFIMSFVADCGFLATTSLLILIGVWPLDIPRYAISFEFLSSCGLVCAQVVHVALLTVSLLFGIPTAVLFLLQTRNIATNLTTNEIYNRDKYPYLKTPADEFHNPYDKGCLTNCSQVLCMKMIKY